MPESPQDLLFGSMDLLVLQSLAHEERHGFAVSQWVHERTRGVLRAPDGALYKALHRLEARGWIRSRWGRSEKRRKAKYYRITEAGQTALAHERDVWATFSAALDHALESGP